MSIQSIKRASDILSLFSPERPSWRVTEIAKALGLAKTTVSSIMKTLQAEGFVEQGQDSRRYILGPKLFTLGIIAGENFEINQKAEGQAQRLAEKTGLICRVAIWDRDAALVTLEILPRDATDFLSRRIGPRVVAYCSSLGRALLSRRSTDELNAYLERTQLVKFTERTITERDALLEELEATRNRGYAVNNQELNIGTASLAVAIFRGGGMPAASISLTGHPNRVLGSEEGTLATALQHAASDISRQLGYAPQSPWFQG